MPAPQGFNALTGGGWFNGGQVNPAAWGGNGNSNFLTQLAQRYPTMFGNPNANMTANGAQQMPQQANGKFMPTPAPGFGPPAAIPQQPAPTQPANGLAGVIPVGQGAPQPANGAPSPAGGVLSPARGTMTGGANGGGPGSPSGTITSAPNIPTLAPSPAAGGANGANVGSAGQWWKRPTTGGNIELDGPRGNRYPFSADGGPR